MRLDSLNHHARPKPHSTLMTSPSITKQIFTKISSVLHRMRGWLQFLAVWLSIATSVGLFSSLEDILTIAKAPLGYSFLGSLLAMTTCLSAGLTSLCHYGSMRISRTHTSLKTAKWFLLVNLGVVITSIFLLGGSNVRMVGLGLVVSFYLGLMGVSAWFNHLQELSQDETSTPWAKNVLKGPRNPFGNS